MWIKVIYCTKDTEYAKRISNYFDREYGSKIEINICSSMGSAFTFMKQNNVDMALFGDEFEKEMYHSLKDISCTVAILTEQAYEMDDEEIRRIDKFRRGDKIYKDILEVYAAGKKVKRIDIRKEQNMQKKLYVFTSASGGTGTSTIARAYARKCAVYEKVLYLDLGLFNFTQVIRGNPNGLDEIIMALKSRRNILPLKLQSAVAGTEDRVFTYGPCSSEIDLLEMNAEDAAHLINGIQSLSEYQKVIIDAGTGISFKEIEFMKQADSIIYVLDESDIGKRKYEKFQLFMEAVDNKEQMKISRKLGVFRNKVKESYENVSEEDRQRIVGWAPFVPMNSYEQVIDRIAQSDSFSSLEIRNAE